MSENIGVHSPNQRLKLEIHGAVQGVGFRPFVYRLATELGLAGWIINDSRGVFIEVEGASAALQLFLERLPAEKPPRSILHSLESDWLDPAGYQQFEIRHSQAQGQKTVLVLPDIATCDDCLTEVLDLPSRDRRAGYPFTNCTNCGPRFSIIQALPYDRPNTTMRQFVMCPACQGEYENPLNRRFHAQPNACPVCGPQLALYGPPITDGQRQMAAPQEPLVLDASSLLAEREEALLQAVEGLQRGQIVAAKGLGGFHLMVDASNAKAVAQLRARKPRPAKPLAVMARDLGQARTLCQIPDEAETLLTSVEAPIVLLHRRPEAPIAENVAPDNPNLGVMLPYTPLHHLLLREFGKPVVATSGNLTDEPISIKNQEAAARLGHIADLFLVHNRPIERHVDDSVAWMVLDQPQLLRRARGYAPLPVLIPKSAPTILAVGAHLKNTVALSIERQVFISQHIGDLETAESMAAFERVIADFLRLYEASPVAIAHDKHPDYLSTRWALQRKGEGTLPEGSDQSAFVTIPVQHHHAHLAACLAENGVEGPALGVIWDGTGYGPDGTVWGGEFLLGDAATFTRVAHLRPFRLPGGEAAVKEPRRVALALLWELYGQSILEREELAPIRAFWPHERRLLGQMLARGLNSPVTTSAGRLFDGIAALLDLHQQVSFESQAAMALEFAAAKATDEAYRFAMSQTGQEPPITGESRPPFILDWQPVIEAILVDLQREVKPGIISSRFHNALVEAIIAVAKQIGQPRVALSGGCFQNRLLTERVARRLSQAGYEVLLHRQVPPNDGGISLGQVAVAAAQLGNGKRKWE